MIHPPFPFAWRVDGVPCHDVADHMASRSFDALQWRQAVKFALYALGNVIVGARDREAARGPDLAPRVAWSTQPGAVEVATTVERTVRGELRSLSEIAAAVAEACFRRLHRPFIDTDEIEDLVFAAYCVADDLWHRDRVLARRLLREEFL